MATLTIAALTLAAASSIALAPAAGAAPATPTAPKTPVATGATRTVGSTAPKIATSPVCPAATPGHATCFSVNEPNTPEPANVNRRLSAASAATDIPAGFGPADLASAYKLDTTKGAGQTVAIVDAGGSSTVEADLATYRATYGLPACTTANGCFTQVNQIGALSPLPAALPKWPTEISLDVDMVSAVCPLCKILLVSTNDNSWDSLGTGVNVAVALGAKFVSNSYGGPDISANSAYEKYYNHPGVAITVSTGDYGYGTAYPAASKYVTAVGGTTLSQNTAVARGWGESVWYDGSVGTASGCSPNNAQLAAQASVGTGCSTRAISDVSAVAQNLAIVDGGAWRTIGGTSASSPIIAGVYALAGPASRNEYPNTYPYAHQSAFFDVTTGNNGTCPTAQWCTAGVGWDGPTGLGTPNGSSAFAVPAGPALLNDATATTYSPTLELVSGHVDTHGGANVTANFRWGTTTSYGQTRPGVAVASGNNSAFSTSLTGLTSGVTYHYQVIVVGTSGGTVGPDQTFTAGAPNITNAVEYTPGAGAANFLVQGQSLTSPVTATVSWGPTLSYGSSLSQSVTATAQSGTSQLDVGAVWAGLVKNLTPGVTYHYGYTLTNSAGSVKSVDQTFIAGGVPTISAVTGASPGAGTADFSVVANTYADSTGTATLNWGPTASYGNSVAQSLTASLGSNGYTLAGSLIGQVTGLTPGVTYHYSYTVTTIRGSVSSTDRTFVASAGPLVTNPQAVSVGAGKENFLVQANLYNDQTFTVALKYGPTSSYGTTLSTPSRTIVTQGSDGFYTLLATWVGQVTTLTPGATYHFAYTVTTPHGTTTSADQIFVAGS